MKIRISIDINSGNQDVIDNPIDCAERALRRAREELTEALGDYLPRDPVGHNELGILRDLNGNHIGEVLVEVEQEDLAQRDGPLE